MARKNNTLPSLVTVPPLKSAWAFLPEMLAKTMTGCVSCFIAVSFGVVVRWIFAIFNYKTTTWKRKRLF
jgi:hypothetical protein